VGLVAFITNVLWKISWYQEDDLLVKTNITFTDPSKKEHRKVRDLFNKIKEKWNWVQCWVAMGVVNIAQATNILYYANDKQRVEN